MNFITDHAGFISLIAVIVIGGVAFIVIGARLALNRNATPEPTKGMGDEPWANPDAGHQGEWGSPAMRGIDETTKGEPK